MLRTLGLCLYPGSNPASVSSLGLSFPPTPKLQPSPSFGMALGSTGIGTEGRQGQPEGETKARGVSAAPPSARTAWVPGASPQHPTPQGSGSLSVQVLLPCQPSLRERLRNHLSLDPRGRAEEGQAGPSPASCPRPSPQPLSSLLPPVPGHPPPPECQAAAPFVRKGEGKELS